MTNPYINYYAKQIGRGIPGYRGMRYQKGYGFLTSLVSKAIFPLFQSIKSVNPSSLIKVASDVLKSPGLQPGKPIADDIARIGATATGALINSLQRGKGKKYKTRKSKRIAAVAKKRRKSKGRTGGSKKKKRNKRKTRSRRVSKKRLISKRICFIAKKRQRATRRKANKSLIDALDS